ATALPVREESEIPRLVAVAHCCSTQRGSHLGGRDLYDRARSLSDASTQKVRQFLDRALRGVAIKRREATRWLDKHAQHGECLAQGRSRRDTLHCAGGRAKIICRAHLKEACFIHPRGA